MPPKAKANGKATPKATAQDKAKDTEPKAKAKAKVTEPKAKAKVKASPTAPKRSASSSSVASEAPPVKKQKSAPQIETQVVKGKAPVDKCYPALASCHVYEEGSAVWDCMLNQSDVKNNNNKFYVIQLLQSETDGGYVVWNRWGRVGVAGQNSEDKCGTNLAFAKSKFMKKFQDKTQNHWDHRANYKKIPGKYHLIEMDYEVDGEASNSTKTASNTGPSSLPKEVQSLMRMICDVDMM